MCSTWSKFKGNSCTWRKSIRTFSINTIIGLITCNIKYMLKTWQQNEDSLRLQVYNQTTMEDLRVKSLLLTAYLEFLLKHYYPKRTPQNTENSNGNLSIYFKTLSTLRKAIKLYSLILPFGKLKWHLFFQAKMLKVWLITTPLMWNSSHLQIQLRGDANCLLCSPFLLLKYSKHFKREELWYAHLHLFNTTRNSSCRKVMF